MTSNSLQRDYAGDKLTVVTNALRVLAAVLAFLVVVGGVGWRLARHWPLDGSPSDERWALASFRDVIYYPLLAIRDSVNPYDSWPSDDPRRYRQRYPASDQLPLYSPLLFVVFAPFGALPRDVSMVAYATFNLILLIALAWCTFRLVGRRASVVGVLLLSAALVASQPGRGVINSGQVALPLALAVIGALHYGDRQPWLSTALVTFSTFKPTYGGPLGLLLIGRRNWRSGAGGLLLGGLVGVAGMIIVFGRSGDLSLARLEEILFGNHEYFRTSPTVVLTENLARIDLAAAIEYIVGLPLPAPVSIAIAGGVLGLTMWFLGKSPSEEQHSAANVSGAMTIVALLVCGYHNVYDAPLLVLPAAAAITGRDVSWQRLPQGRRIVFALLLVPMFNVFWTAGFRQVAESVVGSSWLIPTWQPLAAAANGLALTAAWAVLLTANLRTQVGPIGSEIPTAMSDQWHSESSPNDAASQGVAASVVSRRDGVFVDVG